jgi:hypothetical protein
VILANAADRSLERGRLWVVMATIAVNIIAVSLLAFAPWSDWRTGAALNIVDNCLLIALRSPGATDSLDGFFFSDL